MDYLSPRKRCSYFYFQFARLSNDHQAVHVFSLQFKKGGPRRIHWFHVRDSRATHNQHCILEGFFAMSEKIRKGCFVFFFFSYLPCWISNLTTRLSYVNRDDFAHDQGIKDENERAERQKSSYKRIIVPFLRRGLTRLRKGCVKLCVSTR